MAQEPHAVDAIVDMTRDERLAFFDVLYKVQVLILVTVCAIGIAGWEHFILLPAELRTWKLLLAGRWMPVRALVLLARYSVVAGIVVTTLFFFDPDANCYALLMGIYALYVLLWASSACIFMLRLSIIYDGDRRIVTFFTCFLLTCVTTWLVVLAKGYQSIEVPTVYRAPHTGKCAPGPIPAWCSISWAISTAYDASVLLATWIALRRYEKSPSRKSIRTRRWIWNSNFIFFSTSIFFNVACMLAELLFKDNSLKHLPAPVSYVMHVVVASRLVLASKGWASGALAEEEWELEEAQQEPVGRIRGLPLRKRGEGSGRRSPLSHTHTIPFDVTIEERIEYRDNSGAAGTFSVDDEKQPSLPAKDFQMASRRGRVKDETQAESKKKSDSNTSSATDSHLKSSGDAESQVGLLDTPAKEREHSRRKTGCSEEQGMSSSRTQSTALQSSKVQSLQSCEASPTSLKRPEPSLRSATSRFADDEVEETDAGVVLGPTTPADRQQAFFAGAHYYRGHGSSDTIGRNRIEISPRATNSENGHSRPSDFVAPQDHRAAHLPSGAFMRSDGTTSRLRQPHEHPRSSPSLSIPPPRSYTRHR
ncbi:unnamed protein product [Sympodiomycopsis kandeliae]